MKLRGWILAGGGLLFACSLGVTACGPAAPSDETTPSPTPSVQQPPPESAAEIPPAIQKRWDYLNRLRQSDAYSAIDRTLFDQQNHLGVVLASNLTAGQTASVMAKVMEALAQKFPDEDMVSGRLRADDSAPQTWRCELPCGDRQGHLHAGAVAEERAEL